jgi:hypothetical protein
VWDNYFAERHDDSRHPSSNTEIAGFDPGVERAVSDQSQDGDEMAEAHERGRPAYGTEGAAIDGLIGR